MRTLDLVRTNSALFGRDPGPLVGRVVQPVLFVLLMQPLYAAALGGPTAGTEQVVLGQLVLFGLLGMSVVGGSILTERRWNTLDRLRTTPVHVGELLAGKAIPVVGFLLVQQVVLVGLGMVAFGMTVADPPMLALAGATWAVTVLCLGAAIATAVRSLAQFTAVVDIGSTIVAGLSGALVPLAAMPDWARTVAPVWPGYWAMEAMRSAGDGDRGRTVTAAAVLLGFAAVAAVLAGVRLRRGWGRNTLL